MRTYTFLLLLLALSVSNTYGYTFNDKNYPYPQNSFEEMVYSPSKTVFTVWAPTAKEAKLSLYNSGHEGGAYKVLKMKSAGDGLWTVAVSENLKGKFYTFNILSEGKWMGETAGVSAKAVGVNGNRGAVIDLATTNPEGWDKDVRPELKNSADIILYEMHHRDLSISPTSGIKNKGKFVALTEHGTVNADNLSTGIDHLVELGVTHVHLLPSFDYASVDETRLQDNTYNWGYDPKNYNVPEGSYATDPYNPESRIREFKEMVQALHNAGIRVVMDVVYNHTFDTESSGFHRTAPGYYYRYKEDGSLADASACGNETASEREMMRRFMIESVEYWMKEYHVDGFRFDLMGIHDIETMNQIQKAAQAIDPAVYIYGEGWAAQSPQLPESELAMKANTYEMPRIAAFSDEMRDALRGPFSDNKQGAFLAGLAGGEESIKFGLVGAINHPQVDNEKVNYSKKAWADQPTQMISYVSCHDDMCLVDRLTASMPNASEDELIRLNKLAQTFVFTSQGVPFIYAGEEVFRNKKGVHNSYKSPDDINQIDWNNKTKYNDVYNYYKGLIGLRKAHPAFRMGNADMVRQHMEFIPVEDSNVVAFRLKDHANGDSYEEIVVAFNANKTPVNISVNNGVYEIICKDGVVDKRYQTKDERKGDMQITLYEGLGFIEGDTIEVSPQSAIILGRK